MVMNQHCPICHFGVLQHNSTKTLRLQRGGIEAAKLLVTMI
jgi:hypothetical protein